MGTTKVKATEEKPKVKEEKPKKVEKPKAELKEIVRVIGTDLDGSKPLGRALLGIKGISHSMSRSICLVSGFDFDTKLGSMNESEMKKLEDVIKNPAKFGAPSWFLNRRKDVDTGKDLHFTGSDLDVLRKFDIKRMVDMRSYKGVRHMLGLPVRGQRTRSSFRKGRVVGVVRKSVRIVQGKEEEKK